MVKKKIKNSTKIHIDGTFLSNDKNGRRLREITRSLITKYNVTLRAIADQAQNKDLKEIEGDLKPFFKDNIPFDTDITLTIGDPRIREVYTQSPAVGKTVHMVFFDGFNYPQLWDILLEDVDKIITDNSSMSDDFFDRIVLYEHGYDHKIYHKKEVNDKLRSKYDFIVYITNEWSQKDASLENITNTCMALQDTNSLVIYHPTNINKGSDYSILKRNIQSDLYNNLIKIHGTDVELPAMPKILILGDKHNNVNDRKFNLTKAKYMNIADLVVSVTKSSTIDPVFLQSIACGTPVFTNINQGAYMNVQEYNIIKDYCHTNNLPIFSYVHARDVNDYDMALGIKWAEIDWDIFKNRIKKMYDIIMEKTDRDSMDDRFVFLMGSVRTVTINNSVKILINEVFNHIINED